MKLKKKEDDQIIQFIQELDFAEARGFPLLFAFKKTKVVLSQESHKVWNALEVNVVY